MYLKCEVLLLADVFEKCGNDSLKNYELCRPVIKENTACVVTTCQNNVLLL